MKHLTNNTSKSVKVVASHPFTTKKTAKVVRATAKPATKTAGSKKGNPALIEAMDDFISTARYKRVNKMGSMIVYRAGWEIYDLPIIHTGWAFLDTHSEAAFGKRLHRAHVAPLMDLIEKGEDFYFIHSFDANGNFCGTEFTDATWAQIEKKYKNDAHQFHVVGRVSTPPRFKYTPADWKNVFQSGDMNDVVWEETAKVYDYTVHADYRAE